MGYFIPLYNNLAQTKIVSYLYCCETEGCNNVIRVLSKTQRENCPKCGKKITDTN